ncbi:ABC transporter permease [Streptomyces solicathayae]|uniref:ABC transporter permease n=1 Tax=Streptomyces solicathayae TaxID=3081768 RepID=A0ABZ0M1R5_9ACTN|nr:ABC transporter permease [Streptomyces sp. HUAS YS2]WOX25704.1 ABC transporter permease [Streptomyces sp. HUAS YS2]
MPATTTRRTLAVLVLIPLVVALALWAFAWPAARVAPRDLPLGVAGPATATAPLEQSLARHEGAFDVHRYPDAAAARKAIEDRIVYGAAVVTPQGPELLTATAGSPAVAQLLREAVTAQLPAGAQPKVTDVVPAPAADPRGGAFASSLLPLAIAGAAAGAVVTLLGLRGLRAGAALVGAAALAGLTGVALAHSWLEVLTGSWWAEAGVLGLTVLAIGATMAGLAGLLGPRGLGIGGLLMILIGNPFSGVATAPQLLPEPAGLLGQWLPPGAAGQALRSVAFFDGNGAGQALLVLALWAAAGLTAVLATGRRAERVAPTPGAARPEPELIG